MITAEEIAATPAITNAHEAIEKLRPTWLRLRRTTGIPTEIRVYVNGAPRGGVVALTYIEPASVVELRRLTSNEALARFGPNHNQGAILVTTR